MSNQENTELIEVILGLLEKSKQQDESIQKAIKTLESEKNALETFRSDFKGLVVGKVGESTKTALNEPINALKTQINRIGDVTHHLQQAKKNLDWRNSLFYFGTMMIFVVSMVVLAKWLIPSFDEIGERKAELERIEQQISHMQAIKNLDITTCNGKTCVKVDVNQCNYKNKKGQYCITK